MGLLGTASPEIFLYDHISNFVKYLYKSYDIEKENHVFSEGVLGPAGTTTQGKQEYLKQARILLGEKDPKKQIKTALFLDREKMHTPSIFVNQGEESFINSGLGVNYGYLTQDYLSAQSSIKYHIRIVTRNQIDATIIFHFLKSFLFLYMPFFDNYGFKNMKMNALPLSYEVMKELEQPDIYYLKGIDVDFEVDYQIPSFRKLQKEDREFIETAFCHSTEE